MNWIDEEDPSNANGYRRAWSGRCPECGSDQVYESDEPASLDFECSRCGAVIDDEGDLVKPGHTGRIE